MVVRKLIGIAWTVCALVGAAAAQQNDTVPEQPPRKAILEMFTGGEDAFKKHLTVEAQERIKELLKSSVGESADPAKTAAVLKAALADNMETFDAGPILFSYNNGQVHERLEIRIDSEDLRGDQDEMQLSLHSLRNGMEEDLPVGIRLMLDWKVQQNIWRLNAITVSANMAVGDPRIFDKSSWIPPLVAPLVSNLPAAAETPTVANESAKIPAARAVRLITLAENVYSKKHPELGFTCFISELVGVGRGLEDGEPYTFMAPEFAQGVYNGYRFSLHGCSGQPVRSFQVMAEPLKGTGRAYCSDGTRELRGSDDGSGLHCLASGKIVHR